MNFQCESCGRAYVAGEQVRGRAFRMKCKQCGEIIVVKSSGPELAGDGLASVTQLLAVSSARTEALPPTVVEDALSRMPALLQAAAVPIEAEPPPPGFAAFDFTPASPATLPPERDEAEDAFAALSAELREETSAEPAAEERVEVPAPTVPSWRGSEPSVDAAASPAAGEHASSPIALVAVRQQDASAAAPAPPVVAGRDDRKLGPAMAKFVTVPEKKKKKGSPVLAGVAVLAVICVGAYVVVRGGGKTPVAPVAVQVARPAAEAKPVEPPKPAVAEAKPVEPPTPVVAEAKPAKRDVKAEKQATAKESPLPRKPEPTKVAQKVEPAKVAQKVEPAKVAQKVEPAKPEPAKVALAPAAAAKAEREPEPNAPPDARSVDAAVTANAKLFRSCVTDASKAEPDLDVAGRQVEIFLTVKPTGEPIYPTIGDAQLRDSRLGQCLKTAGTRLRFPPFDGPPARVRVSLVLAR